jgi:hypothetical protein
MLELTIDGTDLWDPVEERFYTIKPQSIALEHSLLSISKWEAKWHKPFLGKTQLTNEEIVDYIRCMTITRNVNPLVYRCLTDEHYRLIEAYIDDPHTATWFSESKKDPADKTIITAERIYHLMFAYSIDKDCEKWHLNRLLTQIRVEYEETKPHKKRSKSELIDHHRALNAARRKARAKKH